MYIGVEEYITRVYICWVVTPHYFHQHYFPHITCRLTPQLLIYTIHQSLYILILARMFLFYCVGGGGVHAKTEK